MIYEFKYPKEKFTKKEVEYILNYFEDKEEWSIKENNWEYIIVHNYPNYKRRYKINK